MGVATSAPKSKNHLASVFWDRLGILFIDYFNKKPDNQHRLLYGPTSAIEGAITRKRPDMKKKTMFMHQLNSCYRLMKTRPKHRKYTSNMLPHSPYLPDLIPSDFYLFADVKIRFESSEDVIGKTEAYFAASDQSSTRKVWKCQRSVGIIIWLIKETMLVSNVEFW